MSTRRSGKPASPSKHTKSTAPPAATAADRVVMLLSLVGYLSERDFVPVAELAKRFGITPTEVRELMLFLGTAGVPGDTERYQHEDLFDIDWDALEERDEARLTRVIAVDEAPRFAPAETAALIAGLHALEPVLPAADAERARTLSHKLAQALGTPAASLSLEQDHQDPRMALIVEALRDEATLRFCYRDAAGHVSERVVKPLALDQDGDAWYLRGFCLTRQAERSFRVAQMSEVGVAGEGEKTTQRQTPANAPGTASTGTYELIATVPSEALTALSSFAPRVIEESAAGRLRVAIDAWHSGLPLQLMRIAPGRIVIESPPRARMAVHDWASRALAAYDA
ncbi:helix-turn-helix transcriptional regulator [Leucobacter sp. HY1908]